MTRPIMERCTGFSDMTLRGIDASEIHLVYGWLTDRENAQWLDFGNGAGLASPLQLQSLSQRDTNCFRVFTVPGHAQPIGLVALSSINRAAGSGMIWYVLGDRAHTGRGYTSQAVSRLLGFAFGELGLRAVHAWTVEDNAVSIKVLQRNGFRFIGRQRQCHAINGNIVDRLLFDLLRSEFRPTAERAAAEAPTAFAADTHNGLDPRSRKQTLRMFSNGVYVMTSRAGDRYGGATVTWVSQASFKPPLVMAAVRKDSNVFQCLVESRRAVIHVLGWSQKDTAQRFFTPTDVAGEVMNGEPFQLGSAGIPILRNPPAYAECLVRKIVDDSGDHSIVLFEVVAAHCRQRGSPLTIADSPWEYGG